MKHRATVRLVITYDDLYAPPDRWNWNDLLDVSDPVEATMIDGPSPIEEPASTENESEL